MSFVVHTLLQSEENVTDVFRTTSYEIRASLGLALFSSGSAVTDEMDPGDPVPTSTVACVFKGNSADDGGAIYSAAGYDIVEDSSFEANFAGEEFNFAPIIYVEICENWLDVKLDFSMGHFVFAAHGTFGEDTIWTRDATHTT